MIGRGREWLQKCGDSTDRRPGNAWDQYLYDARRFTSRSEARQQARKAGGTVYRFDPLSGDVSPLAPEAPDGSLCDRCRGYSAWSGMCVNPKSEFFRVNVSYTDVCAEWEEKP